MTIGEAIRNKRREFNLSQDQLAERIGLERTSVSKWERNLAIPTFDNIILLSSIFNVPIDYWVTFVEQKSEANSIESENTHSRMNADDLMASAYYWRIDHFCNYNSFWFPIDPYYTAVRNQKENAAVCCHYLWFYGIFLLVSHFMVLWNLSYSADY